MNTQLMINDIVCDNNGHTGRVIELYEDSFIIRADGEEYHGENTRPLPLTSEWIVANKVHEVCEKNSLAIDFSRKRKLKISIMNGDKIVISYFYPTPQYVHELQHILRNFNRIEL